MRLGERNRSVALLLFVAAAIASQIGPSAVAEELPTGVRAQSLLARAHPASPYYQLAQLGASDGQPGDEFGISIAVCGQTIVVGASEFNSSTIGAAYVFVEGPNGWASMTQIAKLTASDGQSGAIFGSSVACSGDMIVVGAPSQPVGTNSRQGEAYVFVKPDSGWVDSTETARLISPDGSADDYFGYSVAVSGKMIAVGAPQASGQVSDQGKAYIFEEPKGGWRTSSNAKAVLTASNAEFDDGLGISVSLTGDAKAGYTLAVGAAGVNSVTGAVYVFVEPPGGWETTSNFNAELTASNGQPYNDLGYSVSISGDTIAAGAYGANAAYIFVEPDGGWTNATETAELTGGAVGSYFGYSLSLSVNELAIGSANDPNESAVFVFVKPEGGWESGSDYSARLSDGYGYGFGFSVATADGIIAVGSIGVNELQGTAYVFGK
jgi:hypothetical protein